MKEIKVNGRLILKEIIFDKVWERKVSKNNNTSCKITLPMELINKEVYVIVKGD